MRFEVREAADCRGCVNSLDYELDIDDIGSYLVDTKLNTIVYSDAYNCEYPEDMTLGRDLSTFVDLLNTVAQGG